MKSKKQLKEELHKLIDSIEDEHTLNVLNEDVVPYVIEKRAAPAEEELTEEQQQRLQKAMQQADEGRVVPLDEFYSKMDQWLTR